MNNYKYETHMHTAESSACAVSTAAEQVRAYVDRGYAGIIVTDHFFNGNSACPSYLPWKEKVSFLMRGYEEAKEEGEKYGLDVFFGWEYTIFISDFLTYGLEKDFLLNNPGMDDLSIEDYNALVRKNGGYIAQAHPYLGWSEMYPSLPAAPHLLDGIEVFNANKPNEINKKALIFAEEHHLPKQSGSDSHQQHIRFSSGIAMKKKAESIFDIIEAIKRGHIDLIVEK